MSTPRRMGLRPWHVAGVIGLLYIGVTLIRSGGDPRAFAVLCPDPQQLATGHCGYDGQFAYHIATDPAGAAPLLDVPAYRYQRIGYPLLARVVGLGQAGLIVWTLIAVNWIALLAGTAIVEALLVESGVSRWPAVAYALFAGTLMPVRLDLTEPLAYALALGGVWLARHGRCGLAGGLLALAALTKETTLLFVAALVLSGSLGQLWADDTARNRSFRCALVVGVTAVVPFVVWQLVLRAQFGQFGIGSGGALGTPFEVVPLRGWWSIAAIDLRAFAVISLIMLPMAIVPALVGLWVTLRDFARRRFDVPATLLFFNAAVVLVTPQSTFREPLGMARLTVGLVAATVVYAAARRSRRGLNYAWLWVFTLALALNESG